MRKVLYILPFNKVFNKIIGVYSIQLCKQIDAFFNA